MELHPSEIIAQQNQANRLVPRVESARHLKELTSVVRDVITGNAHPYALSDFAARAIQRGMPVDPGAMFRDEKVLESEARFIALCLPGLSSYHRDCKLWLANRLKRPEERIDGSLPWNIACGGSAVNPTGE